MKSEKVAWFMVNHFKAKQKKLLASQVNFQNFWWGREALFCCCNNQCWFKCSGGNNHACLRHKRFTDNDRVQQTSGNDRKRTQFFFPNVKTINAAVKTHTRRCL